MKIKLLDCTLRDGGYVNDWKFGEENSKMIIRDLEDANIDIIEIGFLRKEEYSPERTVFNAMRQIEDLIIQKKTGVTYSVMAESAHRIDVTKLEAASDSMIDMVRIIIWKTQHNDKGEIVDALEEGYSYCKQFVDKGYRISIQPARVEQYTDEEFRQMLKMFSVLNPEAVYVVDSWGTMFSRQILHYMQIAEDVLDNNISIGFHGHNNQMQVFSTTERILSSRWEHNLIIDSSIFGIGRCAGNLNTEIIAKYLNEMNGGKYIISPILNSYEKCIKEIYKKTPWGYSIPYLLTAKNHANPNYGNYFNRHDIGNLSEFDRTLLQMSEKDRVLYSDKLANRYLENME